MEDASAHCIRWLEQAVVLVDELRGASPRADMLHVVADRTRGIAGAQFAAVLLQESGSDMVVEAVSGAGTRGLVGTRIDVMDALSTQVALTEAAVMVDDARADGRLAAALRHLWSGLGRVVLAPLRTDDELGALVVGWEAGRESPFPRMDKGLLTALGRQISSAFRIRQAQRERARLAVLEDRNRIAEDLHDVVIQQLYAVGLMLDGTARKLAPDDGGGRSGEELADVVRERLGRAVGDIDDTIATLRRSIFALRDPGDSSDFRTELTRAVDRATPALGFAPRLTTTGPVGTGIPPEIRDQLLPVLEEALSNVARHAHASRAVVDVAVGMTGDDDVVLTVHDNGRGLPDGLVRESGLANLRHRAEVLHGSFEIVSLPGGGTRMRWSVPLRAPGRLP